MKHVYEWTAKHDGCPYYAFLAKEVKICIKNKIVRCLPRISIMHLQPTQFTKGRHKSCVQCSESGIF